MLIIERLCSRFHRVVELLRSRYSDRETLVVEDEHDVQDLMGALLTIEHDDVQPLVWMPPYAQGLARRDFLLAFEKIVVVARKAQEGFSEKEMREHLAADIQKYSREPRCLTLVWFVYDPERQIKNSRALENELSQDLGLFTVRVMIAPKDPFLGKKP